MSISGEVKRRKSRVNTVFGAIYDTILAIDMVVLGVFLILIGLVLWARRIESTRKERKRVKSEGEKLINPYIIEHERKVIDDEIYEEYEKWCMSHGELPMEKKGFDELRIKEWELNRKVRKAMR